MDYDLVYLRWWYTIATYGDQNFCFLGREAFQCFEFYKNEAGHDKYNFKWGLAVNFEVKSS